MLYFWLTSAVHIANRASMAESVDQSRKKDKKKKKKEKKRRKCQSTSSEPDLTAATAACPPMTNRPRTDSQPCISYASTSSLSEWNWMKCPRRGSMRQGVLENKICSMLDDPNAGQWIPGYLVEESCDTKKRLDRRDHWIRRMNKHALKEKEKEREKNSSKCWRSSSIRSFVLNVIICYVTQYIT